MEQLKNKRIFIVDDDPFWTAILSKILEDLGYEQLYTFENGNECVEHLHLNPGLVFLDYQMDDIDGLSVLEKIKDYYPGIHVVFCTAYENLTVAISAIDGGSVDYLLKANASVKEIESIIEKIGMVKTS
jgi:CheY-like chemotaxis protein